MSTLSLLMPTYNRDFIIELAIQSILLQKETSWKIELVIADDGSDGTEGIVNKLRSVNPDVKIVYLKHERMPLSDKFNYMVHNCSGQYYGLIGSDDIQSLYKVSAFEKSVSANPDGDIFGQWSFIYHDIIFDQSSRWVQNRDRHLFKAGSFVIVKKELHEKYGGYDPGLWRSVDSSFAAKLKDVEVKLVDMAEYDSRILDTAIAVQHLDNIWRRKSKGLRRKSKQTKNFLSERVDLDLQILLETLYPIYAQVKAEMTARLSFFERLLLYLKH
ncbi:MAG: glycosyltransferase family 2 protein [Candidatus Marinimicrobia bacterium]|nr:glycosyltransferase family 2 protein [Candidatus Neomarinimicrobiota bacterium]